MRAEAARLERESAAAGFWDDGERARAHMRRLASRQAMIETWDGLDRRICDAKELIELAALVDDEAERIELAADMDSEIGRIAGAIERESFQLAFSGPYDERNAIIELRPGTGGVDAQDWAEMLQRMYLRWAERSGFDADLIDVVRGDEAGIKSAIIEVKGDSAYGWLRSEHGPHRLVRISPFDNDKLRHTAFAEVVILPEVEGVAEIEIDEENDIKMDVFRASGHGGQNVQKNSTAVRITHLPSGIVVSCQNERSLKRNRESAMTVLKAKLLKLEEERQEAEEQALRGERKQPAWGNQIRSYVLHPYQMVKDLRTQWETSDTTGVLDGEVEPLMRAWLQTRIAEGAAA